MHSNIVAPTAAPRYRLGILVTHPIQYYSPWFAYLATRFDLTVYYTHRQTSEDHARSDFGVAFEWNRELLSGYEYQWLENLGRNRRWPLFFRHDTPGIGDIIKNDTFDAFLIFGWYYLSAWQAALACRKHRIPVLMRGDSHLNMKRGRLKRAIKRIVYPQILPSFDAHLYVGTRNFEYLKHYDVPDRKLYFAPHFVDVDFFRKGSTQARVEGDRERIRDDLGIPKNSFLFSFIGTLIPRKSPELLIHALKEALASGNNDDIYVLFIGEGSMKRALMEMSASCNQRVRFLGFINQSELPKYYQCSDAVILPSEEESWGLVVNEAAACGIPAIVSENVGCAPDLIDDRYTGFSFPDGDVAALKDCMIRIVALYKNHRAEMLKALVEKSVEFSMSNATDALLEAIGKLTGDCLVGLPTTSECK